MRVILALLLIFSLVFYGNCQNNEKYITEKADSIVSTIVQCDSFIVYKDFQILTKKESRKIKRDIRHSLKSKDSEYCFFMYRYTENGIQLYKNNIEKKWWSRKLYIHVDEVYDFNF